MGEKVKCALAQHQGVSFENKDVGEIKVTSAGLRHSRKEKSDPMKDAFLCDSKALQYALRSGKAEVLPTGKGKEEHVEVTFGITAKVKVDGKSRVVHFIIH